ncbi:autolysin [Streptococcus pneumoniae]|nr:autolysin [Streptococcus pneumoniae]
MDIDRNRLRTGLPQVGVQPYRQVHAHSTGNRNSTAQNEADYHYRKDPELGFFSHVVGNGRVMQVGPVNNGSWDVGGGWNTESYAAVELIESHSTKEEFMADYRLYIELLRNLADEAGLPKTLDTDDLAGIKTHEYCTNNQPNNHSDGSYPKDKFEKINGTWYYFDGSGYMLSDRWKKHTDGNWYYFDQSGEMATGWKKIAEKWYYFDVEGAMKTGWVKYKDTWYYLDAKEGAMVLNAFIQSADGTGWYYLKPDGTLADKPEFTVEPDGLITVK